MATGGEIIVDLSNNDDDDCVLESVSYRSTNKKIKNIIFDDIFKENPLLAEVIEKCFNLESSEGMLRVINKTLVDVYKEADPGFKSSAQFETVLKKTLINLDRDPQHKFSHIKDLCEKLRASKFKKRVQLITLEKKIKKKGFLKLKAKRKSLLERRSKKQKTDVIDLDKYEEIPIINLDQNDSDDCPIVVDDEKENCSAQEINNKCIMEINSDELTDPEQNSENLNCHKLNKEPLLNIECDKENHSSQENECSIQIIDDESTICENGQNQIDIGKTNLENANEYNESVENTENDLTTYDNSRKSTCKENCRNTNDHIKTNEKELININHDKLSQTAKENGHCFPRTNSQSHSLGSSPEKLLIPQRVIDLSMEDQPSKMADLQKIKNIEMEIAHCKECIMKFDEQEVTVDSCCSPYVISEKYKEKIVYLYKELCALTGSEVTKRREVRLTVIEGHPPGPVQRLESFLNRNIREDGNPPFPDFNDVVKCVETANEKDNLGWNKQQVMREASALFVHCGRALQKRRQRREWNDLLSRVKEEQCDGDPADNDPELLARLEANRRVAVKKEADLLQRYTMMQFSAPELKNMKNVVEGQAANEEYDMSVNDESSNKKDPPQVNNVIIAPTKVNNTNHLDRNEIVVSSISLPRESISNSVRKQHINLVQNTDHIMPQIITESITNKIYTDEFGLKINDSRNISNVDINFATNIAANFESNIGEFDKPCNVVATRVFFEDNIEDDNLKCNVREANYKCNMESNVREVVSSERNVAANETNISRFTFESNSREVNSIETIFKTESDEVEINECNVAANKMNVAARLTFESNDSEVKCKANVQVNSESKVEVNFGSSTEVNSTEVSFEMESDKVNIKTEPTENVAKLLNDFGDHYTVSIFDIEDPFLVIEISDSSDEDD